jgi:uncharacterized protein (TIGR02145 family)
MTPTDKQTLWNAILKLNNKPYIGSGYGAYNDVKNPALRGGLYNWKYRDMRELFNELVKYCDLGQYEATWRVLQKYKTKIYPAYLRKIYQALDCTVIPTVPRLTTFPFPNANIIGTTIGGGRVTYDGASAVTARGVCYSTSPNPTIADSFTVDGAGVGTFASTITLLPLDSTFYIRAYATNSTGTGYGEERLINTAPSFVDVGPQNWSTTNLRVSTYRNGDAIPFAANQGDWDNYNITKTGAWRYYNDDPNTELIYGKYYNSYAMLDNRLIAPTGYHIPTLNEWPLLNSYLSSQSQSMAALKNISLDVWTFPNGSASNAYLFEAVPGGAIFYNGSGYNMNGWGYYWMYTQGGNSPDDGRPKYAYFGYDGTASADGGYSYAGQGMCVRIIDNDSLVRGQPFGGGMFLGIDNTGLYGLTGFTTPYVDINRFVIGSDLDWGCNGIVTGASDTQDGYANTQTMAFNTCNSLVTNLTDYVSSYNEYKDWYIPASDEILTIIQTVPEYEALLNPFKEYWTSTEITDQLAYTIINRTNTPGAANWELASSLKIRTNPFLGMRRQLI